MFDVFLAALGAARSTNVDAGDLYRQYDNNSWCERKKNTNRIQRVSKVIRKIHVMRSLRYFYLSSHFECFCVSFVLWVEKAERNAHHHHQKQWKDEVNVKQQRNSIMQNTNNKTCPNELQCRVNVRDREKRLARKHSTARRKYVSEYEWLKRESMQ